MEPIASHLAVILHDPALRDAVASPSTRRPSPSFRVRLGIGKALRALASRIEPAQPPVYSSPRSVEQSA